MKVCKILDNSNNAINVFLELEFKRKNKRKDIYENKYYIDINENLNFVLSSNKGILKECSLNTLMLELMIWYQKDKLYFCLANFFNAIRIENLVIFNKVFNKYFNNKELLNTLNYSNLDNYTKQSLIRKELLKMYC